MPKVKNKMADSGYQNVGIQTELFNQVREYATASKRYRSVSEFVHEAIRLRLEQLQREAAVAK